jgi:hypothetical protein
LSSALAVLHSFPGRRASASSAILIASRKGVSFVAAARRRYFGGYATDVRKYSRTVLRDRLVALAISRTDLFSLWCIRRTLPIMAIVITPGTPPLKKAAGPAEHPGQI